MVSKDPMRDAPGDLFEADSMVAHRYRVIGYRGDRGFGQVYEAQDSAMQRRVALMRLRREFSQPQTRDSFYETRSTAAVEDPRIVDLSDYGEDVDGRLFLVMPWLDDAEPLDRMLAREGALPWPRAKSIVEQIAGALEAAHRKGVLHGGLEPSRVLIDAQGRVHIVDLGLAPALTQPGSREVTLTGPLPGKIEYLSPEQVRGEAVDARTDIYALGVIFWELLTGAPPFVGDQVEVADAHLGAALPKLVHGGPTAAPASAEPLLQRALAKRPDQRLGSAAEFLQLLDAIPYAEPTPTPIVIPQAVGVAPGNDAELGPARGRAAPRKRRLGKLELAIVVFLGLDLLLFAGWKLVTHASSSEQQAAAEPREVPLAEPVAEPVAKAAAVEPIAPAPAAIEPEPEPALSVEDAIAAELPPEPVSTGPVRPGGKSVTSKMFREAMVAARDDMLKACLHSRMRRTLKISLKVAPSGRVEYARVVGSLGKTSLGQCVVEHVYKLEFPITHEGGSHTYTMRLR